MTSNHVPGSWRFWGAWVLAFLGFPLGGAAAFILVGGVESVLDGAIAGAACGGVLAAVQGLVLRRHLSLSPSWIVATSLGMAGGLALGVALFGSSTAGNVLPLRGAFAGLLIGLAQWVVLRGSVPRAWVWVPTLTAAWALGWVVTRAFGIDLTLDFTVFGATGALAFQVLTGLALAWLLSQRVVTPGSSAVQPV